jgi:hypothetical protein
VTTVAFQRSAPVQIAKGGPLGLYFAWGAFAKVDGEPFVDAHGDIIPEDDLVAGAVGLAKSNTLKLEHSGGARGEVPLVMPLTTDIKAALGIESPNSGLVVGFRPDVELAKAIDAGEIVEMSIAGRALAELAKAEIAKGADGAPVAKAEHKRTLRQLEIDEISLVKRAAHGAGTRIAIAKRKSTAPPVDEIRAALRELDVSAVDMAKRAPAMTAPTNGHQHLIWDVEEADGGTSYEVMPGSEYGHSHPFVRLADGSISIGEAAGHTHTVSTEEATMADDINKQLLAAQADVTKAEQRTAAVLALPVEQFAFAKRLVGGELAAYLAKSATERAEAAKPVHVAKSGEVFYSSDDARLVSMAKAHDAMAEQVELAKAAAATAEIAKAAAALPNVKGADLIAKAIHGGALTADERKSALADLAAVNASIALITQPIGKGGAPASNDAESQLEALAKSIQAGVPGMSFAKAFDEALATEKGAALYAQAEAAKRA